MGDDIHEWVSFEYDDDTYMFDATFLMSNYMCIYGHGCPGILDRPAPELEQGCCSFGAHFIDLEDRERVAALAEELDESEWQFRLDSDELGGPIHRNDEGEWVTQLVDDACIFLNRPGFPGGAGCALHQAALRRGQRPLDWKPTVCWQVPLRLEHQEDASGHAIWTLREWKRRDWGEGGDDFHWWCTEHPLAFVGVNPVYIACRDEICEMIGVDAYVKLVSVLEERRPEAYRPHPALKTTTNTADS